MVKIVWFTPDCFVDVDFPLVPLLSRYYQIHWVIEFNCWGNRFKEQDFDDIKKLENVTVEFIHDHRRLNPWNVIEQLRIPYIIHKQKPDLVYSNLSLGLYRKILSVCFLNYKKTIFTAHQGKPHTGMSHHKKLAFIRKWTYGRFKYINMFSLSQAKLMHECFPLPKIFQFNLPLKDFGEPCNKRPSNEIVRFTSFGRIVRVKRVDLLIDAACNIYKRGYKNIHVVIAGGCDEWDIYKPHIRYPEIFTIDIRMIDNNEIPNLFNSTHFFVQPYSVVSQSGPMKIGFRYNIPLITSNLQGFTDEMQEGITGFVFESENVKSLEDTMIKAIDLVHNGKYEMLRQRMKQYVSNSYSESSIIDQYSKMFNEVISAK